MIAFDGRGKTGGNEWFELSGNSAREADAEEHALENDLRGFHLGSSRSNG
jgi:hypothetical protein